MRAQISVEMLLIIALFLGVLTPVFYISFSQTTDNLRLSKAKTALAEITNAADYVYSLEVGSTTQLNVDVPDGIDLARIVNHTVVYKVSTYAGISDVFSVSKANLYGTLPTKSAKYRLVLNHTESGVSIV